MHSTKWKRNSPRCWLFMWPSCRDKTFSRSIFIWTRGILLQKVNTTWRPVAYASCSMSTAEERYVQIEKEALAITWGCDKFSMYLLGKKFEIETNHKPLVPLLSSKPLDNFPPWLLRFHLWMMKYNIQFHMFQTNQTHGSVSAAKKTGINRHRTQVCYLRAPWSSRFQPIVASKLLGRFLSNLYILVELYALATLHIKFERNRPSSFGDIGTWKLPDFIRLLLILLLRTTPYKIIACANNLLVHRSPWNFEH